METSLELIGGIAVLHMKGRLDTMTAPAFQNTLTEVIKNNANVELDFAGVQYVSSAGLRTLLIGQKLAGGAQKKLCLSNVSKAVMEVLKLTGFINILTIK